MLDTKLIISEIINLIPFAIFILLIIKQNNKPSISIRSPKLLISENFGLYLISAIFIFSYCTPYNNLNKILYSFYYVSQGIIIISFFMRCQRILFCYKVKYDDRDNLDIFQKKHFYYSENYYFLLMIIFLGIFLFFFLIYFLINYDSIYIFFI